jgi:hypothetical protein
MVTELFFYHIFGKKPGKQFPACEPRLMVFLVQPSWGRSNNGGSLSKHKTHLPFDRGNGERVRRYYMYTISDSEKSTDRKYRWKYGF